MSADREPMLLQLVWESLLWIWLFIQGFFKAFYRNVFPYSMQPKVKIAGKTVLLTGAGGGIGREIAQRLAKEKCQLVLWDRDEALNDKTAQICQLIGAKVHCQTVDLSNRHQVYAAAEELHRRVGAVDILINNAGILYEGTFLEMDDDKLNRVLEVNVKSLYWTAKAFLPPMIESGNGGHVVTLASAAGLFGASMFVDYAASKFAAVGFMESLRNQLHNQGHTNIHFTTVCPIFVKTPLIENIRIPELRIPFLDPGHVGEQTVRAIRLRQQVVIMPRILSLVYFLKGFLPWSLSQSVITGRRAKLV